MDKAIKNLEAAIEELFDQANKQDTRVKADFYYSRMEELRILVTELRNI